MDRFELPDDLHAIGERLAESRAEFTPLELDELHARLRRREARATRRRPGASRFRRRSLAGLLSAALLLTSGAGVVLAEGALGGPGGNDHHGNQFGNSFQNFGNSFQNTFRDTGYDPGRNASFCQYQLPFTHVYTYPTRFGTVVVVVTVVCGRVSVHVQFIPNPYYYRYHPSGFYYRWGDSGPTYGWDGSSFDTNAPNYGPPSMSVGAAGSTFTVPVNS